MAATAEHPPHDSTFRRAPEESALQPLELSSGALAALAAIVGVTGWLYWPTLSQLPEIWDVDPNYSHGWVIVPAALAFAWRVWKDHGPPARREAAGSEAAAGAMRILLGLTIHAACLVIDVLFFDVLSLVLVLSGAVLILGGREVQRVYFFPIAFLIFMAPLPSAWYSTLAINMQQIASAAAAFIFELSGVPVFREGCYIHIPGYDMEVGAACSGLRQLAAIIALSLAIGHLSDRRPAYKWALGLLSIPIAIAANCIRVTLTGYIMLWFGRKWAEGVYHTLEGLAIVGVAAALILGAAWLLAQLIPEKEETVAT